MSVEYPYHSGLFLSSASIRTDGTNKRIWRKSSIEDVSTLDSLRLDYELCKILQKWVESVTGKGMDMKPSRFTEEQIIGILREQEVGAKTADVCRK